MTELFERLRREGWAVVDEWLASQQEELLTLDFKQKRTPAVSTLEADDKATLAKAMSAFANTSGGVIVFGIEASKVVSGQPDRVQAVRHIHQLDVFQQAVDNALRQLTDPPIRGVELHRIEDPKNPGQGVLAVFVPQSDASPHRVVGSKSEVNDRYYQRAGTSSTVMPHAMLAALFGKRPHPDVRLTIALRIVRQDGPRFALGAEFYLSNAGRGVARQPAVVFEDRIIDSSGTSFWAATIFPLIAGPAATWKMSRVPVRGSNSQVLTTARSNRDVVLFPGDRIPLAKSITVRVGGDKTMFQVNQIRFPVKGTFYAVDAPPQHFDTVIDFNGAPDGTEYEIEAE
jgi:hypothetical protein